MKDRGRLRNKVLHPELVLKLVELTGLLAAAPPPSLPMSLSNAYLQIAASRGVEMGWGADAAEEVEHCLSCIGEGGKGSATSA